MFVELSQKIVTELQPFLEQMKISYQISDCTLKEDKERMLHIQFQSYLSENTIFTINQKIDKLSGVNTDTTTPVHKKIKEEEVTR